MAAAANLFHGAEEESTKWSKLHGQCRERKKGKVTHRKCIIMVQSGVEDLTFLWYYTYLVVVHRPRRSHFIPMNFSKHVSEVELFPRRVVVGHMESVLLLLLPKNRWNQWSLSVGHRHRNGWTVDVERSASDGWNDDDDDKGGRREVKWKS